MKKTNLIILLLSVAVFIGALFYAFRDTTVSDGRELYKAYLRKYMKDPTSLVIYNEVYERNGYEIKWTIDYGGRNGFGGMSRETLEATTTLNYITTEEGIFSKDQLK